MRIVDLSEENRELFSVCLEDWSDEAAEAGTRRGCWVEEFSDRGLRAKLALDDAGTVGGMIQYLPIEESWADGAGLYLILCIWVHGYREGPGDFQHRGMGTALLEAAEMDARSLGAKGMAAWGLTMPFWMKASWFRKHGYEKVDRQGIAAMLWKPFATDAEPPRWFPAGSRLPESVPGKVNLAVFNSGWCMAQNLVMARARRAAATFGDSVVVHEVDTSDRSAVAEWGYIDELFIDGKKVRTGPPPSFDKIRSLIGKRVPKI